MPIARLLGFELWICSSNGAVTRSTQGENFHADLLPANVAKRVCSHMREFRSSTVLTFDTELKGSLVVEDTQQLAVHIGRWIEKNRDYLEVVVPIEDALTTDPVQAMFCGSVEQMRIAEAHLAAFPDKEAVTVLKTQYDHRDLCTLTSSMRTVPRDTRWNG